jgi:hypothetical protein
MPKAGNFLERPVGKWIAVGFVILALGVAFYEIKDSFSSVASQDRSRTFMDSQTMQPFHHELEKGESIPVDAPSGGKTGYPAEFCYWTKDGQIKSDPTPVLLNSWIGKSGPTFCPDCGRLVVANNPQPTPGSRPPPTREEWEKRHPVSAGQELLHSVANTN